MHIHHMSNFRPFIFHRSCLNFACELLFSRKHCPVIVTPIELYHTMLKQKILPVQTSSARLNGKKQSFLFSWDSKWLPRDKDL